MEELNLVLRKLVPENLQARINFLLSSLRRLHTYSNSSCSPILTLVLRQVLLPYSWLVCEVVMLIRD